MFQRASNSWALIKASAALLRADKQLVIYPIVSAVASLLVTASFFTPVIVYMIAHHPAGTRWQQPQGFHSPGYYVGLFLFYLVQYFVVFFANTALVSAALVRMRGGEAGFGDGFRMAAKHLGAIFGYALLASTVGMVLKTLSERLGFIGNIIIGFLGLAWNVATYLVAPVLIVENVGPITAVKRSAELLKRTWGEQVIGNVGMGTAFGLLLLGVIAVFCGIIAIGIYLESVALAILAAVLLILSITALALIQASLMGIYTAAVYLFASDGTVPMYFESWMMESAFKPKKK